jgi:hypothetical protein
MATGICFMLVGICGALWRTIKADPNQFMPITGRMSTRKKAKPAASGVGSGAGSRGPGPRGKT